MSSSGPLNPWLRNCDFGCEDPARTRIARCPRPLFLQRGNPVLSLPDLDTKAGLKYQIPVMPISGHGVLLGQPRITCLRFAFQILKFMLRHR